MASLLKVFTFHVLRVMFDHFIASCVTIYCFLFTIIFEFGHLRKERSNLLIILSYLVACKVMFEGFQDEWTLFM
jgi:hypothetical protein